MPRDHVLGGSEKKNSGFGSRGPVGRARSGRDVYSVWIPCNPTKRHRTATKLYVAVLVGKQGRLESRAGLLGSNR